MDNRELELRQCRAEVQELTRRVNALSARIDQLAGAEVRTPADPPVKPIPAPVPKQEIPEEKKYRNLENTVGKNLFAVLASVLVLLGVGVFISTIYEQIPEFVKIIAIFAFGFALLGCGLALYRKNGNNFWLGVASCGMAELLVSIITSHSYFEVLSMPTAYVLILIWIIGSFTLTRIQPTVFKIIGYIGFTISLLLGLSLLTDKDLAIYLSLVASFAILSVFFMVTNPKHRKMNTVMAFASALNLCLFQGMRWYLPESLAWVSGIIVLGVLAVFHGVYLLRAKLSRDAYPFYAMVSLGVMSLYLEAYPTAVIVPACLVLAFGLWCVNYLTAQNRTSRMWYAAFAGVYLLAVAFGAQYWNDESYLWFAAVGAGAYGLYFLTKRRDIAWLGLVCFAVYYWFAGRTAETVLWTFAGALGFFALNSSSLLRRDGALQTAWYVLLFAIAHSMKFRFQSLIYESGTSYWEMEQSVNSVFYSILTLLNTAYLHRSMADRERILRVTRKSIVVMVLQGILMVNCLVAVNSGIWYAELLGVAASMLIVSYSLYYSYKTKGSDRKLMVWQFVKFSLYCWIILSMLDSPDILVNISLLLIAIAAVILGFRLDHKSVRVYGLVLSLLDVVSLVLFNIDYSDSLQLAGGIVLCGALCFVISFIYSKLSKSAALASQ